jgi:hypothetical protein
LNFLHGSPSRRSLTSEFQNKDVGSVDGVVVLLEVLHDLIHEGGQGEKIILPAWHLPKVPWEADVAVIKL